MRSSRVRLVHQRDLACNSGPLKFAAKRFITSLTLVLFPLQKFVSESKVWLDDDVESAGSDEAAGGVLVFAGRCEVGVLTRHVGKTGPSRS